MPAACSAVSHMISTRRSPYRLRGSQVADSVAEGVIPANEADDIFITVGVFIHWEAKDNQKIQDFNYRATKEAIARAIKGEPKASEVTAKKDTVKHPFAAS